MPLKVLDSTQAASSTDLIRFFDQAQQQWFGQLGSEVDLGFGRWMSTRGRLIGAFLPPQTTPEHLISKTNMLAQQEGTAWTQCSMNPSMPTGQIIPLIQALLQSGWEPSPLNIYYRRHKPADPPADIPGLTIIPARASYRHFTELMSETGNPDDAIQHLDDSHLDALLVLKNSQAIGSVQVLTSGQVGTVREWYVSPGHRNQHIGRLLLHRAMEICDRAVLRHIMIGLYPTDRTGSHLCESAGFSQIGSWPNFTRNI